MISVVIPTYEMYGKGVQFLERALESIENQTYKGIEVVVADNSEDDSIKNLCRDFFVNYFRNSDKGMAANTNYAIDHATGDLIKILYQDDYLVDENSLQDIVDNFEGEWLVTGCVDTDGVVHMPSYNEKIGTGLNTIGSPSVLTIAKGIWPRFDPDLRWLLDCDFYSRMWNLYGHPKYLNKINVVIGLGEHQETNHLTDEQKNAEYPRP